MTTEQAIDQNAILEEVGTILQEIHDKFLQNIDRIAELLSQLSRLKLREAKTRFGKLIGGADHIERLAMYGSNNLPKYLAIQYRTLRASTYKGLSTTIKKQISDQSTVIKVQTSDGVIQKRLEDLNPYEWNQVLDDRKGLRDPEEQKNAMLRPEEKLTKVEKKALAQSDKHIFTKVISSPEYPGCLVFFGEKKGLPEDTTVLIIPQKIINNLAT